VILYIGFRKVLILGVVTLEGLSLAWIESMPCIPQKYLSFARLATNKIQL